MNLEWGRIHSKIINSTNPAKTLKNFIVSKIKHSYWQNYINMQKVWTVASTQNENTNTLYPMEATLSKYRKKKLSHSFWLN